jgi:hypothetical protein
MPPGGGGPRSHAGEGWTRANRCAATLPAQSGEYPDVVRHPGDGELDPIAPAPLLDYTPISDIRANERGDTFPTIRGLPLRRPLCVC